MDEAASTNDHQLAIEPDLDTTHARASIDAAKNTNMPDNPGLPFGLVANDIRKEQHVNFKRNKIASKHIHEPKLAHHTKNSKRSFRSTLNSTTTHVKRDTIHARGMNNKRFQLSPTNNVFFKYSKHANLPPSTAMLDGELAFLERRRREDDMLPEGVDQSMLDAYGFACACPLGFKGLKCESK